MQEHEPDIVGFSAFLTTTMPMFKANINALEKSGLRDKVIVMVGGAPVTQEYADAVGADGYAADASTAVRLAKELIETAGRRSPHEPRVADRIRGFAAAPARDHAKHAERLSELGRLLPAGTPIYVTALPGADTADVVHAAAQIRAAGHHPVPHIAPGRWPPMTS